MGNRATVIFTDGKGAYSPAVYLHWNGGAESIYAFLEELDRRKVRADQDYECARFIQLVGEFFDQDQAGGLSLGVANGPDSDSLSDLAEVATDHGDNGFYLVNRTGQGVPMRRITQDYHHGPDGSYRPPTLREWTAAEITAERREIERNFPKYSANFREFYIALHGKVSQYA